MLLSIVTVCRNSIATIALTLESVQKCFGHMEGVEHLVVDGLSTDGTLDVVRSRAHPMLRHVSERDTGIYSAMNKGLRLACGDYVWFLNSDDVLHSEVSSCAPEVLRILSVRRPAILVGEVQMFRDTGTERRPTRYWRVPTDVGQARRLGWHPPHPAFVARRELLVDLGGFDETKRITADFKLMTHAMQAARGDIATISKPLVAFREGGVSNSSLGAILQGNRECYAALRELGRSPARAATEIGIKLARKASQKFVSARPSPATGSR